MLISYVLKERKAKVWVSVFINLSNKTGFFRQDGYILIGKTVALSFSQLILSKQGKQKQFFLQWMEINLSHSAYQFTHSYFPTEISKNAALWFQNKAIHKLTLECMEIWLYITY